MRFSVFTHVEHFTSGNKYYAYAPYVKEMNLWFKNVEEVEVIAPLNKNSSPGNTLLAYRHPELNFTDIPSFNLISIKGFLNALIHLPGTFFKIYKAMRHADHLHIRCPGNIGLLACFVQMLFPKKPKTAKYAGNWDPKSKQPWTYRLQKVILKNPFFTRNMKVLVYGNWKDESENIVPFFTASFSEEEKEKIDKEFQKPFSFIFAGSLVEGKRPLFAVQLIENLIGKQIPVKLEVYGNGELFATLRKYVETHNLEPFVSLYGNQKQEVLVEAYKNAHFAVLPSKSEGWPKAIAEAMFFGCIPVATDVSCVPWMLNDGERGILLSENPDFEPGMKEAIEKITRTLEHPADLKKLSLEAQQWSQKYTLEKFEQQIKQFI